MIWLHKRFIEWFYAQGNSAVEQTAGFKLMYGQVYDYQKKWIKKENISIIHLIRHNVLKKRLSYLTKQKRNLAHSTVKVDPIKVFCDPNTIVEVLDRSIKSQNRMKEKFSNNPYIEITYEDFLYNYPKPYEKALSFLGVKHWKARHTTLRKLNPDSVKEIIENYDEIVSVLKGTVYERFLV